MKKKKTHAGTTRHIESPCLNCGKGLDSSSTLDGDASPSEGDMSICFYCGHVMIYRADLSLRNPNDEEIVELAGDPGMVVMINALGAYKRKSNNGR